MEYQMGIIFRVHESLTTQNYTTCPFGKLLKIYHQKFIL